MDQVGILLSYLFTADFPRYIVLNRNGSANELEMTSRNFNPLVLFNEMKYVCLWKSWSHMRRRAFGLIVSQASEQLSTLGNARPGLLMISAICAQGFLIFRWIY